MTAATQTNVLDALKASQRQVILDKMVLRTALFAEKFYPPQPTDPRDSRLVVYERDVFNNPEHPAYLNNTVALTWAVLQNIEKPVFKQVQAKSLEFGLGVVVVPVENRFIKWAESIKVGQPHVYVGNAKVGSRFRDIAGDKVTLNASSLTLRPATVDEMVTLLDALMSIRPAQTIKTLGDALDKVSLSGDDE